MKYKISNAYLKINGEDIAVGTVLGPEDEPESPFKSETIPNSVYQQGLKDFIYGQQRIGDMVYHVVGTFENFKCAGKIDKIWIDELELMGYDTSKLEYELKE